MRTFNLNDQKERNLYAMSDEEKQIANAKKKEIVSLLIDIFDRITIDTPSNFDEIAEFIYEDVNETADPINWHDGDVAIAFRRWIESKIILI